MMQQC